MDNTSFIDRMASDWKSKKSAKKDDWNWFFKDSDKDGVINGIDCKPYNKKKQDNFPSLPTQFRTPQNPVQVISTPQSGLSPAGLSTMRNITARISPIPTSSFASQKAQSFRSPTDTRSSSLPDLRTNQEKIQASRQALASQLESTAIAGSVMAGPLILPALGATATPTAVGTVGMITGETIGGLHSVAQTGKIDARDIAKNVAVGGIVGGATGYGATKLFSNPSMVNIAEYGPSGKTAEAVYKLPGGAYVNRAVTNVRAGVGGLTKSEPTVQSVTNKLGTTFSQIAGTKLTPAETTIMERALANRLAKDVGMGIAQ